MKPRLLLFALNSALAHVRRNKLMSTFSITTTTVMLLMLGSFLVVIASLNVTLKALETKIDVVAYIKDSADPAQIANLRDNLSRNADVASVAYVSKDEALARMKQTLGDKAQLLAQVKGNPLPASLEVQLRFATSAPGVAEMLAHESIVEDVDYKRDVVQRLLAITNFLRIAGVIIVAGLAVIALFIIVNTTRIAMYARRQEIEIMKLVGATDWFVRWPFIFEGMFLGLVGSMVTTTLIAAGYEPMLERVSGLLTFLPLAFDPDFLPKLLGLLVASGVAIGALGSYISVRRFLDA
ncbi:MAG: ABC transporter permease [Chloroflexi bacterium]|nr:ABC transporter permease [Chloroflexota bacterium]